MSQISKEYLRLFNAVTDAELALAQVRETLLEAQRQAEELFLAGSEEDDAGSEGLHKAAGKAVDLLSKMEYNGL